MSCDNVNHPKHYTRGSIECIDFIEDQELGDGFCYGNAIKYLVRARHKSNEVEDLKKARWYVDRLIKRKEESDGEGEDDSEETGEGAQA
jgi:hypothetical protein